MDYCIVNGRIVTAAEALISVQDRGFRYGDGAFETIAVQGGVPCHFEWHMARLATGLSAIKIAFDVENLRSHCRQLLKQNKGDDGILRIQVTRGIGSRGYWPNEGIAPAFVIETADMPIIPQTPGALIISEYAKISPRALPVRYKLCQGTNSTLAWLEAAENNCFDALLLNEQGQICETSSGNIFWFADEVLYTPALSCGVLDGATRAAVLRLSPYPVREVEAEIEAITQAEAVFITNSVWKALAIGRLRPVEKFWDSAAIAAEFRELLEKDRDDYCRENGVHWQ